MKILITGASGFIGSFFVEQGLAAGHEIWAAVRPTTSRKYLTDPRIKFLVLPLSSDVEVSESLGRHVAEHGAFDACIHAAGATKCRTGKDFFRVNTEGTLRLARFLLKEKALNGRFVFISSLSVMGAVREGGSSPILATDVPHPDTAYGLSKLRAEEGLKQVAGLDYVVLRPTGVYGPRERDYFLMAKSILRHVDFAVGFKPQHLTFIYVRDLVQAGYLALERGGSGAVYHLSDGKVYSSRHFSALLQQELGVRGVLRVTAPLFVLRFVSLVAENVARLSGSLSTLNSDKYNIMRQRNWNCDIRPACEQLGYKPEWPLERGVKEAIAWYKEAKWI